MEIIIKQISDMTDEEKRIIRRNFEKHKRKGMLRKQWKNKYKQQWKISQKKPYEKEFESQQNHLFDIMHE